MAMHPTTTNHGGGHQTAPPVPPSPTQGKASVGMSSGMVLTDNAHSTSTRNSAAAAAAAVAAASTAVTATANQQHQRHEGQGGRVRTRARAAAVAAVVAAGGSGKNNVGSRNTSNNSNIPIFDNSKNRSKNNITHNENQNHHQQQQHHHSNKNNGIKSRAGNWHHQQQQQQRHQNHHNQRSHHQQHYPRRHNHLISNSNSHSNNNHHHPFHPHHHSMKPWHQTGGDNDNDNIENLSNTHHQSRPFSRQQQRQRQRHRQLSSSSTTYHHHGHRSSRRNYGGPPRTQENSVAESAALKNHLKLLRWVFDEDGDNNNNSTTTNNCNSSSKPNVNATATANKIMMTTTTTSTTTTAAAAAAAATTTTCTTDRADGSSRNDDDVASSSSSMLFSSSTSESSASLLSAAAYNTTSMQQHQNSQKKVSSVESHRRQCLNLIEKTLCQWSAELHAAKSSNKWQEPRVTLVTFGSYRLMAYRPDADLDVLALCPPGCTRGDFFTTLLKRMEGQPSIVDIHPIPSAFTPVIKFKVRIYDNDKETTTSTTAAATSGGGSGSDGDIDGDWGGRIRRSDTSKDYQDIQVDLLFGRLSDTTKLMEFQSRRLPLPLLLDSNAKTAGCRTKLLSCDSRRPEYMIDDSDLVGMDEASVRSLNGARVTQLLLEVVPDVDTYRVTLSAVKEWASRNGLYSNVLGFLGGINFAILVARVARRFPKHAPSSLLRIFFQHYATWPWPKPVTLLDIQMDPPAGCARMPVWDANNVRDARHLMPILTPVYPSMNSSYNVGIPQQRRLMDEFIRAANSMGNRDSNWRQIMRPTKFFTRFAYFLQLAVRARSADDFLKWLRFCESRLRILISSVDSPQVSAWPFAHWFRREASEPGVVPDGGSIASEDDCQHEAFFFIGLKFSPGLESVNLKQCTTEFLYNINSWEGRKDGMDFTMDTILREDLPIDMIDQHLLKSEDKLLFANPEALQHAPVWYVGETKEDFSDTSSVRSSSTINSSSSSFDREQSDYHHGETDGNNEFVLDKNDVGDGGNTRNKNENPEAVEHPTTVDFGVNDSDDQVPARTKITPKLGRSCIGDDDLIMMSPTKRLRPSNETPNSFLSAAKKGIGSGK